MKKWTTDTSTPEFEPEVEYCDALITVGFNDCAAEVREFWRATIKDNYRGDEGRLRIRMAAINLVERSGLHLRLADVKCPVLWLHGTADAVYSVANAKEEVELLPNARLEIVDGGAHFLSCSNPEAVNKALLSFVNTSS